MKNLVLLLALGLPACTWAVAASPEAKMREIRVGAYINDIQDLDLKNHSYAVDIYLWFKWVGSPEDPTETLEFLNPYDLWGHTRTKEYEKPIRLPSGEWYQVLRTQGRFSHKLLLEDYPFDTQTVTIEFEDTQLESEEASFVADSDPVSINPNLKIPGFKVGKPKLGVEHFVYPTTFGLPVAKNDVGYSRVVVALTIKRPVLTYGSKLLLPILCVIFCATLMFLFHPRYVDVRVGIGITALLTIVALQITLNEDLPQIDYLILMDKIYLASYLFVICGLGLILKSTRWFDNGREAHALALDRKSLIVLVSAYFVSMFTIFAVAIAN